MIRTVNLLRRNNFGKFPGCSSQLSSVLIGPAVLSRFIGRKCTDNGKSHSVLDSSLRRRNGSSTRMYSCSDGISNVRESYLADRNRSDSVEGIVKVGLSSPNTELPPLKDMSCDDLVSTLIAFDDAGLPTHCHIMQTLIEHITNQMKNGKR